MRFLRTKIIEQDKRSLLELFEELEKLLKGSVDSDYFVFNIKQCLDTVDKEVDQLRKRNRIHFKKVEFLFLPTGSLQEISLANLWSDEFLQIGEEFDRIKLKYS